MVGTVGSVLWRRDPAKERKEVGRQRRPHASRQPGGNLRAPKSIFSFQIQREGISDMLAHSSHPRKAQDGQTNWPGAQLHRWLTALTSHPPRALCWDTQVGSAGPSPGQDMEISSLQNTVKYLLKAQVPHADDPEVPRHLMII